MIDMIENTMDAEGRILPYMGFNEISVEFEDGGTFTTHAPATSDGEVYVWTENGYVPKSE